MHHPEWCLPSLRFQLAPHGIHSLWGLVSWLCKVYLSQTLLSLTTFPLKDKEPIRITLCFAVCLYVFYAVSFSLSTRVEFSELAIWTNIYTNIYSRLKSGPNFKTIVLLKFCLKSMFTKGDYFYICHCYLGYFSVFKYLNGLTWSVKTLWLQKFLLEYKSYSYLFQISGIFRTHFKHFSLLDVPVLKIGPWLSLKSILNSLWIPISV